MGNSTVKQATPYHEIDGHTILLSEEGISGSTILKNYKAPLQYRGYQKSGLWNGRLAIIDQGLYAWQFSGRSRLINIPWKDPRIHKLNCSVETNKRRRGSEQKILVIRFDLRHFHNDQSGKMTCHFVTTQAAEFLKQIQKQRLKHQRGGEQQPLDFL